MKTARVNILIREYFKENKIKLMEVANLLGISQSNLTERLNSSRAITIDEFMLLYSTYGDDFGINIMKHYGAKMLYLEKIKMLLRHMDELQDLYVEVRDKSEEIFGIISQIERGMNKIN